MNQETTIDKSLSAEASSAHSRINVPLNLTVWRDRPQDEQDLLTWFHQHILDEGLSWDDAAQAIGYDKSNVFRLLKGTYKADSWKAPISAIKSYRRIAIQRGSITRSVFSENPISRVIWAGLDYAIANNSITAIIGESRQGKTIACRAWAEANNHGRSVFVTAPPIGGVKGLMRVIASACGINKQQNMLQMSEAFYRAFNRNRILIVDEAHRIMPSDQRTMNPANIELLRDLHDQTGCALALVATQRFEQRLQSGAYQFEQLIGRIGMPIRLPKKLSRTDVLPIIRQFLSDPSSSLIAALVDQANRPGRLGIVTETLKVASRIASKAKSEISEEHVIKSIELRARMTGEAIK